MNKLLNITVGSLLEDAAKKHSDKEAIKFNKVTGKPCSKTWKRLNAEVDKVAKSLIGINIKKGDNIAVWAKNCPEYITLFYAAAKIGAVLVTANSNYQEREIEYLLKQSDSKVVFVGDRLKDVYATKIISDLRKTGKLPMVRDVISIDNDEFAHDAWNWKHFALVGEKVTDKEFNQRKNSVQPDDVTNILYTSGTTGDPKGVMLTHNNIVNNAKLFSDAQKLTSSDKVCAPVPFFHCFGPVGTFLACTHVGATMVPLDYNPKNVAEVLKEEKCSALYGTQAMFIGILNELEKRSIKKNDLHLKTGVIAGSKASPDVLQKMYDMGIDFTQPFGMTETSPCATFATRGDSLEDRKHTVGKVVPHTETKVIDPQTGKESPIGTQGEFCSRGPYVMRGYYKKPKETAEAIDKDGYMHSGDLVTMDERGYFRVVGRIKDMIIRGGENIASAEVEEQIMKHNAVKEAAVYGVPHKTLGEAVAASIVIKTGESLTETEIKEFLESNHLLAKYKIPTNMEFVEKLPMTASGKIQKFKLVEKFIETLKKQEAKKMNGLDANFKFGVLKRITSKKDNGFEKFS